jgi:hypothetical protein
MEASFNSVALLPVDRIAAITWDRLVFVNTSDIATNSTLNPSNKTIQSMMSIAVHSFFDVLGYCGFFRERAGRLV